MKKCNKCRAEKALTEFFKRKMSKDGLQPICKCCDTLSRKIRKDADPEREREYQREYRLENADAKAASDQRWYAANKEHCAKVSKQYHLAHQDDALYNAKRKAYYVNNGDVLCAGRRIQRAADPEKFRARRRQHYANNKAAYVANAAKRRADELNATPAWVDLMAIRRVYEQCRIVTLVTGIEHEVDHIIPIRNKKVCGLHVHWNLQILMWRDNAVKSNKFVS